MREILRAKDFPTALGITHGQEGNSSRVKFLFYPF